MARVALIIKATRLCNLRCAYCHDWRTGPGQTMPFEVLAAMTAKVLRDPEHRVVDFIWHGGETTVLKGTFYRKAMFLQSRLRRPDQVIINHLQTNATRLTDEWARFFQRNEFRIGISIDGPPELHDLRRLHVSGRGSFDDVLAGMHLLRRHGVPFEVLMVIDNATLDIGPERIFEFFVDLGVKRFGLNAVCPENQPDAVPGTPTEPYVPPRDTCEFLVALYDCWVAHGDQTIEIRELTGLRRRIMGAGAASCTLHGSCLGRFFIVEPNGDVAHCDLFLGDARYSFGNVLQHTFADFRTSANMAALKVGREQELAMMRSCPEFGVCNGWCPHERYLAVRHDPSYREGCCGLRPLIEHIRTSTEQDVAGALLPIAG